MALKEVGHAHLLAAPVCVGFGSSADTTLGRLSHPATENSTATVHLRRLRGRVRQDETSRAVRGRIGVWVDRFRISADELTSLN